ncbi:ribosome small subunit-dependent GTPase A [Paludisphaera mucosa]|uniref:Small ribosomal subunit biogenesis GTPase RsgA n=1 Tax=Paludisphaera mucosa TaxID=3030827 RepID=A0ABT6FGK5_9BACT|nr:ribosome small subunit-dependent GTPase A [Paludisphaera mucosa]MDG3006699.1 ribosome small subunit-dependent GTPase A [Paludisphaera mucosa]
MANKKKKVRIDLKKNRQKRTRANDLTRAFGDEKPASSESIAGERVRPKGEMSRRRTIMTDVNEAPSPPGGGGAGGGGEGASGRRAVDESAWVAGRVVRIHGLLNVVDTDDGRSFPCHVRRLLKSMAIDGRNVVAVGDRVWFRPPEGGGEEGVIERVEARSGVVTRGYRGRRHVLAANVDSVFIVSALAEPGLKISLIDRYLAAAEVGGVRPVIVLNKADLVDVAPYQWVVGLYTQLGYETIVTSAPDGRGIDRLRGLLRKGVTAISGQSGVGKSSLLNVIQPGLNLRVNEVSDWTSKGKHTTTTAELIRLNDGGYVVDTPGLRQFELWGVLPAELEGCFVEFRPFIPLCRFPDCSHTHENRCAVKDAVYWGWIHAGRYESYLKLYHQKPDEGF